jgi:hypothetical protein
MNKKDIKRMKGINREVALEQLAQHGPQHGKSATMQSKRDKANCPRRQRKDKSWMRFTD